jgi:GNAT superfamily N-acetyltransferase
MNDGRLEVTEEILERVVYGMENQKDLLFLDPSDGVLHPVADDNGTFIPLPPWGPTEGYRLMDGFTGTLPDTMFRERLLAILHSGTGVFRHFKDALKERSELEGLWRRYKRREMRKTALSWLNRWSVALALEALGPEPEDWDDLPLEDFSIRAAADSDMGLVRNWDHIAESEAFPELTAGERNAVKSRDRGGLEIESADVIVAESASGEPVGFSWAIVQGETNHLEGRLMQVFVVPEFRGLGIGRRLATCSLEMAEKMGAVTLNVKSGASGKRLEPFLEQSGFSPVITWWRKSL